MFPWDGPHPIYFHLVGRCHARPYDGQGNGYGPGISGERVGVGPSEAGLDNTQKFG